MAPMEPPLETPLHTQQHSWFESFLKEVCKMRRAISIIFGRNYIYHIKIKLYMSKEFKVRNNLVMRFDK
jgi:hypothetical protein